MIYCNLIWKNVVVIILQINKFIAYNYIDTILYTFLDVERVLVSTSSVGDQKSFY